MTDTPTIEQVLEKMHEVRMENERLRAEVERLKESRAAADTQALRLQAEIERLWEALRWLLQQVDDVERTSVIKESDIYERARQALQGVEADA